MIRFNKVSHSYKKHLVIDQVNLDISEGNFYFLTGPSGSGKTTLLKLCTLELTPNEGQITFKGQDARSLNRDDIADLRKKIGIIKQENIFIEHLNLYENVVLPVIAAGQDPKNDKDNVLDLLAWIGLGDKLNSFPMELSGGEQTRLALARALTLSPEIIVADEPTGNLDWQMSERVLGLLVELNKLGKTVIIATHDLGIIRAAKGLVKPQVLRIDKKYVKFAGADL